MTGLKMAKASEKDIDAAGELCQILNELDEGNRFRRIPHDQPADITELEDFNPDRFDHLKILYLQLMNLMHYQPSFHNRVIGGMCYVIMYDANQIVDPNSDFLDLHPRFGEMHDDLQRETQAARYWNMRYHQMVQELDQVKASAQRISQEWATIWGPIDDLVRPLTPLGKSVSAKAVELINKQLLAPPSLNESLASFAPIVDEVERRVRATDALNDYIESLGGLDSNGWHDAPADDVFKAGFAAGQSATPIPKQEPFIWLWMHPNNKCGNDIFNTRQDAVDAWAGMSAGQPVPMYVDPVLLQKEPRGQNRYGLDMSYMIGKLNILIRDIDNYKGNEAARTLLRLAKVADESVFNEPEFSPPAQAAAIPDGWALVPIVATDEMGLAYDSSCSDNGWYEGSLFDLAYSAMLSAAPKPDSTGGESKRLAPWPDFKGNPIHEGDTIKHPTGDTGKVVFIETNPRLNPEAIAVEWNEVHQWRVDYGDGLLSSLCLQIGEKGMAVVIGGES